MTSHHDPNRAPRPAVLSPGRLLFFALSVTMISCILGGTFFTAYARQQDDGGEDSLYKYLAVFSEVFGLVQRAYVEETPPENLLSGAFEGAIDALDPFSLYIPAGEVERYSSTRNVGATRSGLVVLKERGTAYVVAVESGSPADQVGIRSADILSLIDGRSTREMPLYEIRALLAGKPGTRLALQTIRLGRQTELEMELAEYTRPGVALEVQRGVAVLRLGAIHSDILEPLDASLTTLISRQPALPDLDDGGRLLVDLRGLAGGDQEAAYQVAQRFVSGKLGALLARDEVVREFDGDNEPAWSGDLVVLLDRSTQGAAEILAAILEQSLDAKLVGDRSFGHSGRIKSIELSNGDLLQVTDAFYTGPDREPIAEGLEPDVWVRQRFDDDEDTDPTADTVLERGLAILLGEEEIEEEEQAA